MPFYNCGTQDFIRLISGSESPASDLNACVRVGKLRPVRIKATTYLGNLRILAQLLLSNIYLKLCQRLPYDKYNLIHQKTQLSSTRLNHNTITERWNQFQSTLFEDFTLWPVRNQFKVHYLKTSHCDLSETYYFSLIHYLDIWNLFFFFSFLLSSILAILFTLAAHMLMASGETIAKKEFWGKFINLFKIHDAKKVLRFVDSQKAPPEK